MIHMRATIFSFIEAGMTNKEIWDVLRAKYQMDLALARIENYREVFIKLNAFEKQEFLDGKRSLNGAKL